MDFAACLEYLDWLGHELSSPVGPGKFDLHAITRLLAELDQPQRRFRSLHIAGTNGKGSTAAYLDGILQAAGRRHGRFTSPHLERVTERITLNGEEIEPAEFARHCSAAQAAAERLLARGELRRPPSFFETLTAIGFLAFAGAGVEFAVVETGMGGRLDATNLVQPAVCAITPIGMDHERYLGSTLSAIAGEKAGIFKPGVPVVAAPQPPEAEAVLRRHASAVGAPWREAAGASAAEPAADGRYRFSCRYRGKELQLEPSLRGRHQIVNAWTAVRAAEVIDEAGGRIPAEAVAAGIGDCRWPGRLERLPSRPGRPEVWADGAHNPAAARVLAGFMVEFWGSRLPVLIFGCMRDKAIAELGEILFPRARAVIATAPRQSRAARPETIHEAFTGLPISTAADLPRALALADDIAGEADILIAGSLYLVGEARAALGAEQGKAREWEASADRTGTP